MSIGFAIRRATLGATAAIVAVSIGAGAAWAQTGTGSTYKPVSGQGGKDVVWVPSPDSTVGTMLDLAKVTASDFLVDLGSGDGKTVIAAAKRGARAMGVEFNPEMVGLSKRNAAEAKVTDKVTFLEGDLFKADFSKATVVTMFLLPDINLRLRPQLLEMKPGTRIVSNSFTMGDWEEDGKAQASDCTSYCTAYLWIIPAKVAGTWQLGNDRLTLTQTYQKLSGTLGQNQISDAKMTGDAITFKVGNATYTGKLEGTTLTGTKNDGSKWSATKR